MTGRDIELCPSQQLIDYRIGWIDETKPTTDVRNIYLPESTDRFDTEAQNFDLLKVMATHQIGHIEFNSFGFEFDRPSRIFPDLRPRLEAQMSGKEPVTEEYQIIHNSYSRLYDLFHNKKLIRFLFTLVEDARVDYRIAKAYPGLRQILSWLQKDTISELTFLDGSSLHAALLCVAVCASLDQQVDWPVPEHQQQDLSNVTELIRSVCCDEACVEDAVEAAIRIYDIFTDKLGQTIDDLGDWVAYRGAFKPELTQLLDRTKTGFQQKSDESLEKTVTKELEVWVKQSIDVEVKRDTKPEQFTYRKLVENLVVRLKEADPDPSKWQAAEEMDANPEDERIQATEPYSFVYDEWDFLSKKYKSDYCLVREIKMREGDSSFYQATVDRYAYLARQTQNKFEMMLPKSHRNESRCQSGEDFDLDAAIEATIDLRIGKRPSEKLFIHQVKKKRQVTVAFLLDMSASVSEAVDTKETKSKGRRQRIVDLEKEALVLMTHALKSLEDSYGIFGFSGYGRKDVQFYSIKDFEQDFSPEVARRIDSIGPLYATRMGAAIRHASSKLMRYSSRSRFLFLISDGRPQDWEYSCQGEFRQYAISDTRMALLEARRIGITPFCLTVDRQGHDYLKAMMRDMDYEVLSDIQSLPSRLPMIYRQLTHAA